LCIDSPVLKKFLGTTSEEAMDDLKKEIAKMTMHNKCQAYKAAFASELEVTNVPTDDRIISCRLFLHPETEHLRELVDGFKEVVDAQQAVTKALTCAQRRLATICGHESDALAKAGATEQPRVELVAGLRQQSDALLAAPALHYDLLLAEAERELLDAEAMKDALDSVEDLQKYLQESKSKVESMGETLKKVEAGGEIPSTGTGVARMLGIAPKKDREQGLAQMRIEHEQKRNDVASTEEFIGAARTVLLCVEVDSFFKEKVARHRQTKDSFATVSQKTAGRLANIWGVSDIAPVPQGYPVGVTAAEPPVQWE